MTKTQIYIKKVNIRLYLSIPTHISQLTLPAQGSGGEEDKKVLNLTHTSTAGNATVGNAYRLSSHRSLRLPSLKHIMSHEQQNIYSCQNIISQDLKVTGMPCSFKKHFPPYFQLQLS